MAGSHPHRPRIAQINLITTDLDGLAAFYRALFDGQALPSLNPDSYAGVDIGAATIGISSPAVRDVLRLEAGQRRADPVADQSFMSIELGDTAEVDAMTEKAVSLGAICLDGPRLLPFGWYAAVLRDPARHVFRLFVESR